MTLRYDVHVIENPDAKWVNVVMPIDATAIPAEDDERRKQLASQVGELVLRCAEKAP